MILTQVVKTRPGKIGSFSVRCSSNGTNQVEAQNEPLDSKNLRTQVIDLYKNLLYLSREWPTDLRPQIKRGFLKNKDVQDAEEIVKLIGRGEYICREITATYHLRKYRAMKRRYYNDDREKQLEEAFKRFE